MAVWDLLNVWQNVKSRVPFSLKPMWLIPIGSGLNDVEQIVVLMSSGLPHAKGVHGHAAYAG